MTDTTAPAGLSVEMEPCALCGGFGEFGYVDDPASPDHGGHFLQCANARCGMSVGLIYNNGEDPRPLLLERWNTRAARAEGAAQSDREAVAWTYEKLFTPQGGWTSHFTSSDPGNAANVRNVTPLFAHPPADLPADEELDGLVERIEAAAWEMQQAQLAEPPREPVLEYALPAHLFDAAKAITTLRAATDMIAAERDAWRARVCGLETEVLDAALSDRLDMDAGGSPLTWKEVALAAEARWATMRTGVAEIMAGLARGDVGGDDVVWFSSIETLWEFCASLIDPENKADLGSGDAETTAAALLSKLSGEA